MYSPVKLFKIFFSIFILLNITTCIPEKKFRPSDVESPTFLLSENDLIGTWFIYRSFGFPVFTQIYQMELLENFTVITNYGKKKEVRTWKLLKNERMLIVEDDPTNRGYFFLNFSKNDYSIVLQPVIYSNESQIFSFIGQDIVLLSRLSQKEIKFNLPKIDLKNLHGDKTFSMGFEFHNNQVGLGPFGYMITLSENEYTRYSNRDKAKRDIFSWSFDSVTNELKLDNDKYIIYSAFGNSFMLLNPSTDSAVNMLTVGHED